MKFKIKYNEYKIIFKNSQLFIKSDFLIIKKADNADNKFRILPIISKLLGNAPYRNYLRRCTKESCRVNNLDFLFKSDFIFIYKKTLNKKIKYCDIENLILNGIKNYKKS